MHNVRRHFFNASGFTLIEMLVVISIITLLISITLPNLGMAKENSRRTICGTRVRELVNICVAAANDDRQKLPDLHNDSGRWSTVLYQNAPNPHTFDGKARDYLVRSHGLSREFLYCPSNDGAMWNRDDFWEHGGNRSVFGYVYYAAAPIGHAAWIYSDSGTGLVYANAMTDQPRHQIIWSDVNRRIEPYGWYRFDEARAANHFHTDSPTGSNNGYLDSHVEWVSFENMKKRMVKSTWSFWF